MTIGIRAFGSTGSAAFTVTLGPGPQLTAETQTVTRSLWFDRDLDGSWLVWAADPLDRGSGLSEVGAIAVRDATVATFLEALGQLVAVPSRFEHEPCFDGMLRWVRALDRVRPVRPPPMATLLEDVPIPIMRLGRTTMVDRDP